MEVLFSMYFNKKLLLVFVLLIFVSIGGVCANNVSNTTDNNLNTDTLYVQDDSANLNSVQISSDLNQVSQKEINNSTVSYVNDSSSKENIYIVSEYVNSTQNMTEYPEVDISGSGGFIGDVNISGSIVNMSGSVGGIVNTSNSTDNIYYSSVNSNSFNIGNNKLNYYHSSSNLNNHLATSYGDNLHLQNPFGFLFANNSNFGFTFSNSIDTEMNDNMGLDSIFSFHFKILNVSKNYTIHSDSNVFCNYLIGICSGLFK